MRTKTGSDSRKLIYDNGLEVLNFSGGNWPGEAQRLLLRACWCDQAAAVEAWQAWRSAQDFDRIDPGSAQLVPRLQDRLKAFGQEDPNLGRYRGLYRKTWVRNRQLVHRLAPLLGQLGQAGVPTLILGGAVLSPVYYRDDGLRPIGEGEVLVPEARGLAAIDVLLAQGFAPRHGCDRETLSGWIRLKAPGWVFTGQDGSQVSLQWRALDLPVSAETTAAFWARSVPFECEGVPTRRVCATHQLLQVCLQSAGRDRGTSLIWATDAAFILKQPEEAIDWDEVVAFSRRERVAMIVRHALGYLREHLEVALPGEILARLAALPVEAEERAEFAALMGAGPWCWRKNAYWHRFRRLRRVFPEWARPVLPVAYLRFLKLTWRADSTRRVFALIIGKVMTKLFGRKRDSSGAA